MKKPKLPDDLEACCVYCEYFSRLSSTGDMFCKYHSAMKKTEETAVCRHFSFDIFSFKPRVPSLPKAFDFTKL